MTKTAVEGDFDPTRSWWDMNVSDRAEFLERVAQRLEKFDDPTAAQAARYWSDRLLANHGLPPLSREPREPLAEPGVYVRLHEISRWTLSPGVLPYPFATILRQGACYLAYALDREYRAQEKGPHR